MTEPVVKNITLYIQRGTGQGGATAPPDTNPPTKKWVRAKLKSDGTDSQYWFYYGGGKGQGGTAGGEVDLPTGGSFTVSPSGNEVLTSITINETGTPPPAPATSWYSPNPPVKDSTGKFTVADSEHEDPEGKTDSFDVYAKFNSTSDELKCDPIIRNKGG